MANITYLITLTPRGRFFFGGDRAFTASGEAIYSSQSTLFPQQTALLGMLRLALLRQNDKLDDSPENKAKWIGTGFSLNDSQLGKIDALSPVFIIDKTTYAKWIPLGMDYQDQVNLSFATLPTLLEKYYPKKSLQSFYGTHNASGLQNCKSVVDDFFQSFDTVGNQRDPTGKRVMEGFYRQVSYSFKKKIDDQYVSRFAFGLYVTFTEAVSFDKIASVFIGADQSVFSFKAEEQPSFFEVLEQSSPANPKIVLVSDAYVATYQTLQEQCDFILGSSVPFRFMTAPTGNDYYTNRRSENQYNLLARGTVLYPKEGQLQNVVDQLKPSQEPDKDQLESEQEKALEAFRQIGYNYFQILTR